MLVRCAKLCIEFHNEKTMCSTIHSCILFNRKYRYISCSELAHWLWGYMDLNNRKVLPACAVTKIRETFPPAHHTGLRCVQHK